MLLVISVGVNLWLAFKLLRKKPDATQSEPATPVPEATPVNTSPAGSTPEAVGHFYDAQNANFLQVYGEVIQAFRTHDITNLLDYTADQIGLQDGWRVLDAGCGVCGPARYFAVKHQLHIDAVTVSEAQVRQSREFIERDGLGSQITVSQGDFHHLDRQFDHGTYDAVYFLESFGHARDQQQVLEAAWDVLKPGGVLYIKDLFIKEGAFPGHDAAIRQEIDNINRAYRYNVADLNAVLTHLRQKGFILASVNTIDLPLEDFENLTISNDFQELTGINKIDNLQEYIFPVDFFALKCFKPWHDLAVGNSRYFLQNLYYLQVEGKKAGDL
ncbi:MAG: class I SAM-dependent methyltransferase [Bacteroidota bacterium]